MRLFFFILLFLPLTTAAQNPLQIEGYVHDSAGQPLSFANVMALSARSNAILAYGRTDDAGFYRFAVTADSTVLRLKATLLGWQAAEVGLTVAIGAKTVRQDITLYANTLALREVVVRERLPPIRQRSDTTEWRVSAFSDSTENTVEDLLRKLPGVEVGEQGQIKVNGKTVEKILIEGDDLFGNDYTMASRNIRANNLEAIQAIDRHQANPVLKNVKSSDALVLNLKIKEDRKRILSGNFTAGGGWGDEGKYYLHGNLFSFGRRSKTFFFADVNNAGSDPLPNAEFFMNGGGLEALSESRQPELPNESLLTLPQVQELGLPRPVVNPARVGLVALINIHQIGAAWKMKTKGMAMQNVVRQAYFNANRFRLPDGEGFDLREDYTFRQWQYLGNAEVEWEYLPKHLKTRLKVLSQYRPARSRYESDLMRRTGTEATDIPQQMTDRPATWLNQAEWTRKINEKSALQAEIQYVLLDRPQQLRATWAEYAAFFRVDTALTQIIQQSASTRQQLKVLSRWIGNNAAGQWTLEAAWMYQRQSLSSASELSQGNVRQTIEEAVYQNRLQITRPVLLATALWQRSFGALALTAGADLRRVDDRWRDGSATQRNPVLLFSPKCRALLTINPLATLSLYYNYTPLLPNSEQLYRGFLWSDYRSLYRGTDALDIVNGQQLRLQYRYRNDVKLLFINASAMVADQQQGFGSMLDINPLFSIESAFRPVATRRYSANGQIDRFFSRLSSRISGTWWYYAFQNVNQVNGSTARDNFFQTHTWRLEYGSAFDIWFNFFINSSLSYNTARVRSEGLVQRTNATAWRTSWRTVVRPTKSLTLDWALNQTDNYFGGQRNGRFFTLDGKVRFFTAKNYRRSLEFSVHNALNARTFEQVSVSDTADSRNGLIAVPRFFMLTYDWTL